MLLETSGTFCTQAMAEIEKNAEWNPIVISSATCASLSQFFQPLIDQGLTGEGTYLIQYIKDVNDAAFADDEFVQLFHETLKAQGLDDTQTTYATGWLIALYLEEVLRQAATYEGGLDRGNIMLAARNIDMVNPLILDGIKNVTAGATDAYLNEGGRMAQYEITIPHRARLVRARRGHHRPERQHRQLRRHQRRLTDPDNVRRSVSCGEAPHEALRAARHSDGIAHGGPGADPATVARR